MTLDDALADAFRRLETGAADRRSAFHTVTLATIGADGGPRARTLVLRAFDPGARTIRLHADARSDKVAELLAAPRCALHLYDAAAGLQLRLTGTAAVHDDALADAAWDSSREMSRMCYAAEHAPGTEVEEPPPAPTDSAAGRANFRALLITVETLDWLLLLAAGHRRARFDWRDGTLAASWVAP